MGGVNAKEHRAAVDEKEKAIAHHEAELAKLAEKILKQQEEGEETSQLKGQQKIESKKLKSQAEMEWDTMRTLLRATIKMKKARAI